MPTGSSDKKNAYSEDVFTELCPDLKEARQYERYVLRNADFAERRISVLHDFIIPFIYIGKTRHRRCAAENNKMYTKHCGTSAVTCRPVVPIKKRLL